MLRFRFGSIAISIFLVFVLSGCHPQTTNPPTPTSVSTLPVSAITASPAPTLIEYVQPEEPTPDPSLFSFTSFRMESEMIGWGVADLPENQDRENWRTRILRTVDGGENWFDVSPSSETFLTSPEIFILDSDHAWFGGISQNVDTSTYTINLWLTQNGGQIWEAGLPLSISDIPLGYSIDFPDSQHGIMDVVTNVAAGTTWVQPFTTSDGGLHWETLPAITRTCLDTPYTIDVNPCECWQYDHSQTFFSAQEGILQIICGEDLIIYHTHDGGKTWDIPARHTGMITTTFADFVDADNGWCFATEDSPANMKGRALYVTHDGGETWNEINPVIDINNLYDTFPNGNVLELITDFEFIDSQTGWAILTVSDYFDYSIIIKTNDGGFTWIHWVPHWQ